MRTRLVTLLAAALTLSPAISAPPGWRLPVPGEESPSPRGDLTGVLVRMGHQVIQARDFGLQRTADGRIAVSWIQGYDAEGKSIRIERTIPGASPLGFAGIAVGSDRQGFLLTGEAGVALAQPDYPCGLSHSSTCEARSCHSCGDAPLCACADPSGGGACDPISRDWCDGTCVSGVCNQSVNDCRCVSSTGPAPTRTTRDPKAATKAPELEPKAP